MRQRIALGGVSAAVILGLLAIWGGIVAKPVLAMDQVAAKIREAKSYVVTVISESTFVRKPGTPPIKRKATAKWYWLAPGSMRTESKEQRYDELYIVGPDSDKAEDWTSTVIYPAGKPGIELTHNTKRFRRKPAQQGHFSPLMLFEKLAAFSGQADRDLGVKEINGRKVRGFQIDAKKIDPDGYPGPVEIWIDPESNLPMSIRLELKRPDFPGADVLRMEDFHWNIDLDPKVFDLQPPAGYAEATPKPVPVEEQFRHVTEALTIYSELSGGYYPRVTVVYGDVALTDMLQKAGIQGPPTPEQIRSDKYAKALRATRGFAWINSILNKNPDAAYYGKTVGSIDKDKVLLRWKLDDGKYQVIFGDLRGETVTAERLRALEGK